MISNPSCRPLWNFNEKGRSRANRSIRATFFSSFPGHSTNWWSASPADCASRKSASARSRGRRSENSDLLRRAETRDFVDYGMEPEFIGRLPVRVVCDPLTSADLFEILKRSEGSIIRQYERAFRAYGVEVFFEDEALREIAARAARKTPEPAGSSPFASGFSATSSLNCPALALLHLRSRRA